MSMSGPPEPVRDWEQFGRLMAAVRETEIRTRVKITVVCPPKARGVEVRIHCPAVGTTSGHEFLTVAAAADAVEKLL